MKILGVGGHAKVVINAVLESGKSISGIYDDDSSTHGESMSGFKVEGALSKNLYGDAFIAIGNNSRRKKINNLLKKCIWQSVIHPSAIVAEDVIIGEGTVIMAGAIIQPGAKIGKHVIINTGACIDHDCEINNYCHIAPNCSLAGGIKINEGVFLGVGSSIIQNLSIGRWSIVGAGAVVTKDLPPNCTAVGMPAKVIKYHDE